MYVARILYPVKVLGPGNRVGIWMVGCKHGCVGCSNPELWETDIAYKTSLDTVMNLIEKISDEHNIDGFTITGGEPFDQVQALEKMLTKLETVSRDILVYTGYDYETIQREHKDILSHISVLIDGRYEEDKNDGSCLVGSVNQRIIYLDEKIKPLYDDYIEHNHNKIQNFMAEDGIISVGIHKPDYERELDIKVKKRGLEVL